MAALSRLTLPLSHAPTLSLSFQGGQLKGQPPRRILGEPEICGQMYFQGLFVHARLPFAPAKVDKGDDSGRLFTGGSHEAQRNFTSACLAEQGPKRKVRRAKELDRHI